MDFFVEKPKKLVLGGSGLKNPPEKVKIAAFLDSDLP